MYIPFCHPQYGYFRYVPVSPGFGTLWVHSPPSGLESAYDFSGRSRATKFPGPSKGTTRRMIFLWKVNEKQLEIRHSLADSEKLVVGCAVAPTQTSSYFRGSTIRNELLVILSAVSTISNCVMTISLTSAVKKLGEILVH